MIYTCLSELHGYWLIWWATITLWWDINYAHEEYNHIPANIPIRKCMVWLFLFNSLCPLNAIFQQTSESTLDQVMTWCHQCRQIAGKLLLYIFIKISKEPLNWMTTHNTRPCWVKIVHEITSKIWHFPWFPSVTDKLMRKPHLTTLCLSWLACLSPSILEKITQ